MPYHSGVKRLAKIGWGAATTLILLMVSASSARAQVMGLGWLLNPEGSRLFPQPVLYPRHPGKPDPRWTVFDWKYVDFNPASAKYRLYFYSGEDWSARFAAPRINTEITELSKTFNYVPTKQFSYLLFTSLREFRQANIFNVSEGVQGITSTEEATMAIPYWGEARTFDHVSKHEMTHQFQVQKTNDLGGEYARDKTALMPLWFVEGMAEYYSLGGVDAESRVYLRDLMIHADKERDYVLPKSFFDEGPMGFVFTYKLGQAKIDFLEKRYGTGAAQRLLTLAAKELGEKVPDFRAATLKLFGETAEVIDRSFTRYLEREYKSEAQRLTENDAAMRRIEQGGDTADLFRLSPDGNTLALRDFDPLSSTTAISLLDLKDGAKRTEVTTDNTPGVMSLYFFQQPVLALNNSRVAFVAETVHGPVLQWHEYSRDKSGNIKVGASHRFELYSRNLIQASSLAFSPDGRFIAIAALNPEGWSNLFLLNLEPSQDDEKAPFRQITDDYYAWRDIIWTKAGIFASSDRTPNERFNLVSVDPATGAVHQELSSADDQLQASAAPDGGLVFQSWSDGTPQAVWAHRDKPGIWRLEPLTRVQTGVFHPQMRVDGTLYGLVFNGGRYKLYEFPRFVSGVAKPHVALVSTAANAWKAELADFKNITQYKPFSSSHGAGPRIEDFGAFFASGGFFGLSGAISDLMRDYTIFGEVLILGSLSHSSESFFLSDARGKVKKTYGIYNTFQPRLDTIFGPDQYGFVRTYQNREFGVLGALQYPFGPFSYMDLELRLGGVNRTDFSDPNLQTQWDALNPGAEAMISPIVRFGYDRILYEAFTGPISGFGGLVEADTGYFPSRGATTERLRLDLNQYWHLPGRTVFVLTGMAASAFGDRYTESFFVSSDDIMRAYPFFDQRLYGNYLVAGKAELRFPVGSVFGFPPLRGLFSYDIGSVWVTPGEFSQKVASAVTAGVGLNVPPLSLNFMLSHPNQVAPGPSDNLVGHFTLRYLYL